MNFEIYHPFETVILKGLRENIDTESFVVNSGKVFNFYNPLNFRNVKSNLGGKPLPKLPFSIVKGSTDFQFINETVFDIGEDYYKIDIYLFCNFHPPSKWVPGPTFIPFVNEAWIVSKVYLDEADPKIFKIIGSTKNSNNPGVIKYESFDLSKINEAGDEIIFNENTAYLFEEEINWDGNAFCYSPIASIKKDENNEWQVTQFLKDNLPITSFFDSASFEMHNTEMYDINNKQPLKTSEEVKEKNKENYAKKIVSSYFDYPDMEEMKGYIRYNQQTYFSIYETKYQQLKLNEYFEGLESIALSRNATYPLASQETT
jgi:hypothetical protein